MYDAWGKLPSGILSGNAYELGDFDACLRIAEPIDDGAAVGTAVGTVRGQYCLAQLYPRHHSDNHTSDVDAAMRAGLSATADAMADAFVDPVRMKGMDARMLHRALPQVAPPGGNVAALSLMVALCVPAACTPPMVGAVFEGLARRLRLPVAASVTELLCSDRGRRQRVNVTTGRLYEEVRVDGFDAVTVAAM